MDNHPNPDMQPNDQNEKDYLRELAPTLFEKKHRIPEDAPDGYFDVLPDRLKQRIASEPDSKPKGRLLKLVNYQNLAIAAGVALMLASLTFLQNHAKKGAEKAETVALIDIDFSDEATVDVLAEMVDSDIIYAQAVSSESIDWEYFENSDDEAIVDFISEEGLSDEVLYDTNF